MAAHANPDPTTTGHHVSSDTYSQHALQVSNTSSEEVRQPITGFRLYDLPQELQDNVFEYAYPRVDDLKIAFKNTWDLDEQYNRRRKGPSYVQRAFPTLKVEAWLVSKRFFRAAAKAWMNAQTFHEKVRGTDIFTISEAFLIDNNKLFYEFGRCAVVKIFNFADDLLPAFARCQSLMHLKILVDEDLFEPLERHAKLPWEEAFTDDEISGVLNHRDLAGFHALESLPRLDGIKFEVAASRFLNSSSKRETFTNNFNLLLEWARQSKSKSLEVPSIVGGTHDTIVPGAHVHAQDNDAGQVSDQSHAIESDVPSVVGDIDDTVVSGAHVHTQHKHAGQTSNHSYAIGPEYFARRLGESVIFGLFFVAQTVLLGLLIPSMGWLCVYTFITATVCWWPLWKPFFN